MARQTTAVEWICLTLCLIALAAVGIEAVLITQSIRDTSDNLRHMDQEVTVVIKYENTPPCTGCDSLTTLISQWLALVERLIADLQQLQEVEHGITADVAASWPQPVY